MLHNAGTMHLRTSYSRKSAPITSTVAMPSLQDLPSLGQPPMPPASSSALDVGLLARSAASRLFALIPLVTAIRARSAPAQYSSIRARCVRQLLALSGRLPSVLQTVTRGCARPCCNGAKGSTWFFKNRGRQGYRTTMPCHCIPDRVVDLKEQTKNHPSKPLGI